MEIDYNDSASVIYFYKFWSLAKYASIEEKSDKTLGCDVKMWMIQRSIQASTKKNSCAFDMIVGTIS